MTRRIALWLLLCAALVPAVPARASIEEFSTLDVFAPEVDDENALDYFLSRQPEEWRAEWEDSAAALRTDQGCMTAGIWYQANEFKARSSMAAHTWLDLGFLEHTDPGGSYQWLEFGVRHATRRFGTFGGRFRPAYDKSKQDFAALWELGDSRSRLQVRTTLSIEDAFNKLWTFRQTQVGGARLEPYRVHPFEPSVDIVWRGAHHRVELADTWLTPSRQDIFDPDPLLTGTRTLRGDHALVLAERQLGPWTTIARYEGTAVRSSWRNAVQPGDGHVDRQRWSAELAIRRQLTPRLRAEGRYAYMDRAQDWRPPVARGAFAALDRMGEAELAWQASERWQLDGGLLYDRIGVALNGAPPGFTYGSRKESRAFISVQARLGRVRVQLVEGIELDSEPYTVSFHHDKGFLHLQTTF